MQAFENYEKLTEAIQHGASYWSVDMGGWSNLLQQINTVIEELEGQVMKAEKMVGIYNTEVIWGEPLKDSRTQFEIEETLRNEIEQQKNWESQTEDQRQ